MSNFWEKRGIVPPQAPIQPVQTQTQSQQVWWAPAQAETPQQWQPMGQVQQVIQPVEEYVPTKRLEAEKAGRCPECGSGNYLTMDGDIRLQASTARCFDCGYPVKQSNSGDFTRTIRGGNAPKVRAAKQLESEGYHPEVIIASLG